jgi:hypothetical protein
MTKSSQMSHLLYIHVATGRKIVTQNTHLLEYIISNVTYIIYLCGQRMKNSYSQKTFA